MLTVNALLHVIQPVEDAVSLIRGAAAQQSIALQAAIPVISISASRCWERLSGSETWENTVTSQQY